MEIHRLLSPDEPLVPDAVAVFDACLGAGYLSTADLGDLLAGTRPESAVFVAVHQAAVAGAAITDRAPAELVDRILAEARSAGRPCPDLSSRHVGWLRSIAVHPQHRRHGVGSALNARRIDHLHAAGCTAVLSLSWRSGLPDTSQGMLQRQGLTPVVEIPGYWERYAPTSASCPVCGRPCRCAAAVHVRTW
jgi:GNAT superfamily N-acetyltransferase